MKMDRIAIIDGYKIPRYIVCQFLKRLPWNVGQYLQVRVLLGRLTGYKVSIVLSKPFTLATIAMAPAASMASIMLCR